MEKRITVLIVESELETCHLYEFIFGRSNMICMSVNSISQAKMELSRRIPTYILLDNHLPDGKGSELVRYIRDQYPCIKIILSSADDWDEDFESDRAIYATLRKPYVLSKLTHTVEKMHKIKPCNIKCSRNHPNCPGVVSLN